LAGLRERPPTLAHSRLIWKLLLEPLWPHIVGDGDDPEHLVVIPSDELFAIPFQIAAAEGDIPLGARVPLSQSVSLAAFLLRSRAQLRRQRVARNDDLAALLLRGPGISGKEIVDAQWPEEHLHIAGDPPPGVRGCATQAAADWSGLTTITASKPEFFVYAGHGAYLLEYGELGPYLEIFHSAGRPDLLTPFDVALRVRLPRNRLTVLGACVAGQGAQTASGDVAGFLRAFIAAGAGAIALPLWSVRDIAVARTAGHLLRASRAALLSASDPTAPNGNGVFDVVATLQQHYRRLVTRRTNWIDHLPLVLYT
jgi:hypothetical protein